ncbi:MAG: hypothetical protein NT150_15365 [Bacteroidetes bacterium]|nr:hypothetical protein [Bacteroidota bacterium]
MNFSEVIHPVTVKEFFDDYYEKKPLYIARNNPSYYHTFLSVQEIDAYLQLKQTYAPNVKMAFQGKEVSPLLFCDPAGSVVPFRVNPDKMLDLFKQGYTIKYDKLHQTYPPLAQKVSAIEQEIGIKIRTSLYITPENSQGYGVHTDRHDVLALQINGAKIWKVKSSTEILPSVYQTNIAVNWTEEGVQEICLKAGDFFYCPRGLAHDVFTKDQSSIHYTLGFKPVYGYNLVEKLSALAYKNSFFRSAVPNNFSSVADRDSYQKRWQKELEEIIALMNFDDVDVLGEEATKQSQINFEAGRFIAQIYQPSLSDKFVLCSIPWELTFTKVACRIDILGGKHDFPYLLKEFFENIKSDTLFSTSLDKLNLNDAQKLKLIKRLLKIQLIRKVD